jgi:uncharacterized protein (TIGR02466 family)
MSENVEQQVDVEVEDTGLRLVEPSLMPIFPTPLFIGKLSDITLCDRLVDSIMKLKQENNGTWEAGNFTTWDDLYANTEFMEFSQLVLKETNQVMDFLKIKRDNHYISGMWANVTNPNHRHPVHLHPNCLLSGILYVKTPEKCGGTTFVDPRPAARVFEPSYEQMFEMNAGRFTFPATKGTMLIWPSWMSHGVERGFTEDETEERIAIAFNVQMVGKIETRTARLELA